MKNIIYKKILLIIILLIGFISLTREVYAESVNATVSIPYQEQNSVSQDFNGLALQQSFDSKLSTIINISLSKTFNFQKQNNSIIALNSTLNIGEKITPKIANTIGNYSFNGKIYNLGTYAETRQQSGSFGRAPITRIRLVQVFNPIEVNSLEITSNNPSVVECINNVCTSKSPGVAKINVVFPQKLQQDTNSINLIYKQVLALPILAKGAVYFGSNTGFGKLIVGARTGSTNVGLNNDDNNDNLKNMTYNFPTITYTVTVPSTTNTPHVTTCTGASGITSNSATINWSYADVDNDVQTQYQVQLSKKAYNDTTFSEAADVVFSGTGTGSGTSHTFSTLTPNTTYYARVKTYNGANTWSLYSSCGSGFTTTPGGTNSCSCNGTRDLTCTTSSGVPTTVTNSTSCALSGSCTVFRDAANTRFTISPFNGLGDIIYSHGGITSFPINKSSDYIYTIARTPGVQSLVVTLRDSYDNKTLTLPECSIGTVPPVVTPPDPKITIKNPKIILNGKCKIDWTITDKPAGMTCNLLKGNTVIDLDITNEGTKTFNNLTSNTRYTISCSGAGITTISSSTICRINPNINEI